MKLSAAPLRAHLVLEGMSIIDAAEIIGMAPASMHRWFADGVVPSIAKADQAAVALGLHPVQIWGDEWWVGTVLETVPGCVHGFAWCSQCTPAVEIVEALKAAS